MSEADNNIIKPAAAPLSHLQQRRAGWRQRPDLRSLSVVLLVAMTAGGIALWQPWLAPDTIQQAPASTDTNTPDTAPARSSTKADALPPFAATQQARAREAAQKALASFVEKQIQLEEQLSVADWGDLEYQDALAAARRGDEEFVREKFDLALTAYAEANAALDRVIEQGTETWAEHMSAATAALDALDEARARVEIAAAARIRPDADATHKLQARIDTLPEVIRLLRASRNHELAGRLNEALTGYEAVRAIDPATAALPERLAALRELNRQQDLNQALTRGFAALEEQAFDNARSAFQEALRIDANNPIASGGLQQVQAQADVFRIRALRRDAEKAMADENWAAALDAYNEIRALDDKIRFAVSGLAAAQAHQRSNALLSKIVAEPHRLSSEKLYYEATEILSSSRELAHRGPQLNGLIDQAAALLQQYSNPVDVTLRSDNATDIIVSNVGRLGFFEEKVLSLRPGTYTIRGSQNGCRDLYLSIEVLPGIEPLDLSCQERIATVR